MRLINILFIITLLGSFKCIAAPNWHPVNYTNSTTLYATVEVEGHTLSANDVVGAFVNGECRAVQNIVIYDSQEFVSMVIQGEIVETINFKIWIEQIDSIFETQTTVESNPGNVIGSYPSNMFKIKYTQQINEAPIANAGSDQEVNENTLVTLDGSHSSDPNGDQITFFWKSLSNVTLNNTTDSKPSFQTPLVNYDQYLKFVLVVNDGKLASIPDTVIIKVMNNNNPPIARAGVDIEVTEMSKVTLDGSYSFDPDSDKLTYLWQSPSTIQLDNNLAPKPSFTAPEVLKNTVYKFSLVVNDGSVSSIADTVIVTVLNQNRKPIAYAGSDFSVKENELIELNGSASFDPDSDSLRFVWRSTSGILINDSIAVNPKLFAPEVNTDQQLIFTLVVNDGKLFSNPDSVIVTVILSNKAPIADAGSEIIADEFSKISLNASNSSDPNNDKISYSWEFPKEITVSDKTNPILNFTAPEVIIDTTFVLILTVSDGQLFDKDTLKVLVKNRKLLLANYTFNGSVIDNSRYLHDGTNHNATSINDRFGNTESAYSFNGIDAYIDFGNWFNLQDFTISFWVKPEQIQNSYAMLIDNNHTDFRSWSIQQVANQHNQYIFGSPTSSVYSSVLTPSTNQWSNIICVHSVDSARFYMNGQLINKQAVSSKITYDGTEKLLIGKWAGGTRFFKGCIDDINIYNYPLNESEIKAHYVPSAVNTYTQNNDIAVYPIPCSDYVIIESYNKDDSSIQEIRVINMAGQDVLSIPIKTHQNKTYVDVSNLKRGEYILRIIEKNGVTTKPLLIENKN